MRTSAAFMLMVLALTAQAKDYPTWEQDGENLPMGIRRVCIADQYYLIVVDNTVPGGGWPKSITPALYNGVPESCRDPAKETGKKPGSNWNTY